MTEVFDNYQSQFSQIATKLSEQFRKSYKSSESEIVERYKELQQGQQCLKAMEVALMDLNGVQKAQKTSQYKVHKQEFDELQRRFKVYEQIIQDNKSRGIIPIDERQEKLNKIEQQIQQGNDKLIYIKRDAYEAEHHAIQIQNNLRYQSDVLDRAIDRQNGTNKQLDNANQQIIELERRKKMNQLLLWGSIGTVALAFIFILIYRLVRII